MPALFKALVRILASRTKKVNLLQPKFGAACGAEQSFNLSLNGHRSSLGPVRLTVFSSKVNKRGPLLQKYFAIENGYFDVMVTKC